MQGEFNMEKIDILLPIYNSYEDTKNCIDSIFEKTDQRHFNLFLLDDKSPDERIKELTDFYTDKYENVIVVRNNQNLGFPGNVNNGFSISKNDVVILNSDTLVTDSWLEFLWNAANTEEMIAAAIPMSNYGIISGVPTANTVINDLFSFEELFEAFKKSKEPGFIEAPVLIGFCMYIKRKALESVGTFDADTFKRGYGEETDWCKRARFKGYKLIVAKESYVHHIGGVSFGEEKEERIRNSRKILIQRYPNMDEELEEFVKANPTKEIRKRMIKSLPFLRKNAPLKLRIKIIKHYLSNTF